MGRARRDTSERDGTTDGQHRLRRSGAAAVGALVALTVLVSPAGAQQPAPPADGVLTAPEGSQRAQAGQAQPERLSAAELRARAEREAGALTASQAERDAATAAAAAALEAYQVAQRAAQAAEREAAVQRGRLAAAQQATTAAQEQLSRYLGAVYRGGIGSTRLSTLTSLVDARSPERLFGGLGLATRVGEAQDDAVAGLTRAQADQADAATEAAATGRAAVEATEQAARARAGADAAVADAAARVDRASAALAFTTRAVAVASAREARIAAAEAIARQRAGIPAAAVDGAFADRTGTCAGTSTAGYPNGRIPLSALCPLWGTSGQVLRADAAAAFDAMSRAYAEEFGAPICVTDSYRDYDGQVAVKAAKPDLAATPGTSNHGWGVALDLCDGIQRFGSPQHRWMQDSSMAFGWFAPAWAQAGGSKPEPWHWEFAG